MRVGIMIEGQEGLTWERWWRLAQAAEDLGYESLCRSDHLTGLGGESRRPSLETWVSLTALATRTRRIRFGPMVSPLTFYHPAILAKMAAAIDALAGGRFDLGIGAGWNEHEHTMYGVPFPPPQGAAWTGSECGARLIRALEAPEPVTLNQPYYPLTKAESYPRPPQGRLRVVIGGRGEKRTLRIVAEVADEWNVTRLDVEGYRAKRQVLAEHCRSVKRDPETIARSLMIPLAIGRDAGGGGPARGQRARHLPRPPRRRGGLARRRLPRRLARPDRRGPHAWDGAGMQRVLLQMLDQEDIGALELFAREVLPKV